jgi:hypothetical protein
MQEQFRVRETIKNIILLRFASRLSGDVRAAEKMRVNFPADGVVRQNVFDAVHRVVDVKTVFGSGNFDKNFSPIDPDFIPL